MSSATDPRTPAERPAATQKALPTPVKLAIDFGPLVVFIATYRLADIYTATAAFMAATVVAVAVAYGLVRRVPVMLLVTLAVVMVFGGLTVWLHDEQFIKMKPTIVYVLFAGALLGGLAFGKPLLGHVFDWALKVDAEGWRKLTLRWGLFFAVMAVVNEAVWRNVSTDTWVSFKLIGFPVLTFLFAMTQVRLLQRHGIDEAAEPRAD